MSGTGHANLDFARRRAALTPDRPALYWEGRWYSYAELDQRATRLAVHLSSLGVAKGDRVGILALNHIAHLDLLFAAPKLGFIHTPFNYRLPAAELAGLLAYIEPKLLFADTRHQALAQLAGCVALPLAQYESRLAAAEAPHREPVVRPEDVHMILFTGGSTGLPKGAMLPYRQVLANCENTALGWGLREDDCSIVATPCFHAALNALGTPLLHLGARVALMQNFEPAEYLRLAQSADATLLFMVPSMYQMLAEYADFAGAELSRVRWAISGGAPCPPLVRERYARRGIRFKQGYGMTEAGVNCFAIEIEEAERHPDSVGRPLPNTEAAIRREDGAACGADEVGELYLRGPHLFLGYYQRPEENRAVLRDGWLRTGDLARRDAADRYFICGRRKEMYISGGENVYPAEVEAVLSRIPGVAECAVIGVPDARWGETGLAALTLRARGGWTAESLRAELKNSLAGYKVPAYYLFLDELPKSAAGKILKPQILRQWEEQQGGA